MSYLARDPSLLGIESKASAARRRRAVPDGSAPCEEAAHMSYLAKGGRMSYPA
jgi:hypothetical protein